MHKLLLFLLAFMALALPAGPARADDISVAGRSVVRVVVVGLRGGGGLGLRPWLGLRGGAQPGRHQRPCRRHGAGGRHRSGSASCRPRATAPSPPISSPPIRPATSPCSRSRGRASSRSRSTWARSTTARRSRLWAIRAMSISPPPSSIDDYVRPLPATRSVGIFSNVRPINGITTLLHTANIARGHSGGPLLDQCGRVLGVNTLITRNQDGDAPFAFAVANRELAAFLRARPPALPGDSDRMRLHDRPAAPGPGARRRRGARPPGGDRGRGAEGPRQPRAQHRRDPGDARDQARSGGAAARLLAARLRRRRHPAGQGQGETGQDIGRRPAPAC